MDLPAFRLNDWLESREGMLYNLAGSTGPRWTVEELLALGDYRPDFDNLAISYAPPAGISALRAEIGAHHSIDPDWVLVTNGASEAFFLLLLALARPGGNVLLPSPAYPAFAGAAQTAHLTARYYRLDREREFRLDQEEIEHLVDDETLLVVANSPQNPTGAVLKYDDRVTLSRSLAERAVPLLVDEVFHPVYFGERPSSAAGMDNVIVIGDMSKAFSLPGLRIGWVIDPNPDRRAAMIRARSYLSLSGSPIVEALALHALRNRDAILDRVNAVASRNLTQLTAFMKQVGDVLAWVPPKAGMLAFPWFRDGRDSRPFCERLADSDVFVAPGDCFGMPDHMRLGFGSQINGLEPALEIFKRELRQRHYA